MRNKYVQMSLLDIYHNVGKGLKNDKPELFKLLDEHINWDELVSDTFCHAFYQRFGRNRKCDLDSFIKSLFLQRIFHYVEDIRPLTTLRFSYEMADYCGFAKVPDATKLTCFKHDFYDYIRVVFERLVDLTEPIYREIIDEAFSDLLIFNDRHRKLCGRKQPEVSEYTSGKECEVFRHRDVQPLRKNSIH